MMSRPVARRTLVTAGLLAGAAVLFPGLAWPADEADRLFGVEWRVVELAGTSPIAGHIPTLTLNAGRGGGSSGCNTYFSTVALDGESISFSEVGSTYIACEADVAEQEREYFRALELARRYKVDQNGLELLDGDGALLARFAAGA